MEVAVLIIILFSDLLCHRYQWKHFPFTRRIFCHTHVSLPSPNGRTLTTEVSVSWDSLRQTTEICIQCKIISIRILWSLSNVWHWWSFQRFVFFSFLFTIKQIVLEVHFYFSPPLFLLSIRIHRMSYETWIHYTLTPI